jgi:hypothetical protein
MKVIELLNMIANGKIKDNTQFEFIKSKLNNDRNWIYVNKKIGIRENIKGGNIVYGCGLLEEWKFEILNDEIELIEEKKIELPEKLEIEQDTPNSNYYIKNEFGTKCGLTKHSKMIADKLNETLDYLKYKEEEKEK